MENKVIKNMEYWKKKNNIPGIEALADSGLTDGRAGSSAFQMATPGTSPNKFLGMTGAMGGLFGGGKKEEGPKELFEGTGKTVEETTGYIISGGDEGTATAGGTGVADGSVAQPVAEDPNSSLAMKKSPLEAEVPQGRMDDQGRPTSTMEDQPRESVAGQYLTPSEEPGTYLDEQEGKSYTDPNGYVEIDDNGYVVDNDYEYIVDKNNVIMGVK